VIPWARQAEESEFNISDNNTTQQAQFLDMQREEVGENGDEEEQNKQNQKKIEIELNSTWLDVWADVRSLQLALGLPPHDLFAKGIFNN